MKTLTAGTPAPAFTLLNQDNQPVSLADFKGKKVLAYFYPKAMTPGCTVQACGLRDSKAELDALNVVVLGISIDPVKRLPKFIERDNLNFTLLSDEDHAVALSYGAWGEKLVNGEVTEGIVRSTVVVDPEGSVRLTQYQVKAQGHVAALKDALGV